MKGEEVIKVTARFDKNNEVEVFICNDCRFETKKLEAWTVEKVTHIDRHSVIAQNHYENAKQLKMGHTHLEQLNPTNPPENKKLK